MPLSLRSRLAFVALMATFLIPVIASNMRGLGHVLTCDETVESQFTIIQSEGENPQIMSSTMLGRDDANVLCDGLFVDLRARPRAGSVEVLLLITNRSDLPWRGTVRLQTSGSRRVVVPVAFGKIEPKTTASEAVEIKLPQGKTEIHGSLLIGP